jgi:hypothetical protein
LRISVVSTTKRRRAEMSRQIALKAYRNDDLVCARGHTFRRINEDGEAEFFPVAFTVLNPNPCDPWGEPKAYGHYLVAENLITNATVVLMSKEIKNFKDECDKHNISGEMLRSHIVTERNNLRNERKVQEVREQVLSENLNLFLDMFREIASPNCHIETREANDNIVDFSATIDDSLRLALNRDLNVYVPHVVNGGFICAVLAMLGLVDVNDLQGVGVEELLPKLEGR